MGIGTNIAGAGLGLLLGEYNDERQLRQQGKLQKQQIGGQMQLGRFNQELAYEMWERTNFEAQRRQMEKAGLNVGLMYGGTGGGGTTHGGSAGNTTGGNAPVGGGEPGMGMQLGMQAEMLKAQIENIKANTEKTKVDTTKTGGVDTQKAGAEIQNILQATQNAEMQASIMEYDKQLKAIQANTAGLTQGDIILQIQTATDKLIAETRSAKAKGNIDEATQANIIKGAELANKATEANINATQTGIKATEATTKQTEQKTENLKQEQITQELQNQLRENGIEPNDSAPMRIISRVIQNAGTSLEKMQAKMSEIVRWLKGENGNQTEERFNEIWNR